MVRSAVQLENILTMEVGQGTQPHFEKCRLPNLPLDGFELASSVVSSYPGEPLKAPPFSALCGICARHYNEPR
jgi:hypothetical protein